MEGGSAVIELTVERLLGVRLEVDGEDGVTGEPLVAPSAGVAAHSLVSVHLVVF